MRNLLILPRSPRRDSTLLNQLSEYANSILKVEVEKSGLEDKIKIGSLSTIQLETERHIVEIFGSRSSVGVDLQYMRGPKGGGKYTEAIHPLTWIQRKSHRFGQGAHPEGGKSEQDPAELVLTFKTWALYSVRCPCPKSGLHVIFAHYMEYF